MKLFIIPTPIGNLKDITLRALEVLQNVDIILCEDRRKSLILLNHYKIKKILMIYHQHNEHIMQLKILNELQKGKKIGLITDAGMPGISDPGFLLIRTCIENNIPTECLPGPTAFIPALVNSGLPIHHFSFIGFLPPKKGRKTKLIELSYETKTFILYESPHKILKTLSELITYIGKERKAVVCKEITKVYENYYRGTLENILSELSKTTIIRGEFVILIEGASKNKKV